MNKFLVLDIGCGTRRYQPEAFGEFPNRNRGQVYEVFGIDQARLPGVDKVVDIDKGKLPLPSNKFDGVNCSHVLEHVTNFFDVVSEIHRVCRPGGVVKVRSPYFSCYRAFTDPEHKRFFTSRTFEYFTKGKQLSELRHYRRSEFKILRSKIHFGNLFFDSIVNASDTTKKIYERFFPWIFPAIEVQFDLEVVK
jgi:SAM-dependent methyltransferase